MALSNLVVEKLEKYGGIDLKRNQQKYLSNALGISIALHLLLILFYVGYSWFTSEERIPHAIHIHSIADIAPPPSTDNNEAVPPAAPPPPSDVVRPSLGIPVPVPDAIAPQLTLPTEKEVAPQAPTVVSNGPVDAPQLTIKQPVTEEEPKEGEFVDVEQEPEPIEPIEKAIQYPEVAKRSGLEGKVELDALIGTDGRVIKVNILKSDFDVFKQAAEEAVKKTRFTPARQNGQPLKVWITRTIRFKLNGK
jgi:periplasmic protein TonB